MNKLFRTMWLPGYMAFTGERRKAYDRQTVIGALIFFVVVIAALIVFGRGPVSPRVAREFAAVVVLLLLAHLLYALSRRETVWQLRLREWRDTNKPQGTNKYELLASAEKVRGGQE